MRILSTLHDLFSSGVQLLFLFSFSRRKERQQLLPVRVLRWEWKIQEVQKKGKLLLLVSQKIVLTVTCNGVAGYLG